ncbi:hypothetical protein HK103_006962 [Boothiomyces macroporosus]|uniref:UspA domain-containing protein n=1 Tax=Boothiomyces macroporosus TaxID=261099 RepID=A0AAD5Y679_9FUNG|nr:hypothetical protein HK103_006962 [Boothiomyces macroporosus]
MSAQGNSKERVIEVVENTNPKQEFIAKRTVCIPVDESDASKHTVQWAIANILNPETDEVVLLHVRPHAFNDYGIELGFPYIIPTESLDEAEKGLRTFSHELLKATAKPFLEGKIHVRAVSLRGEPREEIEYKVNLIKPSFVVMGSRGLNTFSRAILGSVSEHMLHHLTVPVMIVPFVKEDKKSQ